MVTSSRLTARNKKSVPPGYTQLGKKQDTIAEKPNENKIDLAKSRQALGVSPAQDGTYAIWTTRENDAQMSKNE
jgi:hypothetical protein